MNVRIRTLTVFVFIFLLLVVSCSEEKADPCDLNKDGKIQAYERKLCSSSQLDDTTVHDIPSDKVIAHIGVHMEIEKDITGFSYQEKYWPVLVDLVALADQYNIKLTLKFIPQWAGYIIIDDKRLSLVRTWEANGHELAVHHHGPSHVHWDGYTDNPNWKDDRRYLGSIDDMMKLLNQLPVSGQMLTSGQTDEDTDWPDHIIYETEAVPGQGCCLLSSPQRRDNGILLLYTMPYKIDKSGEVSLEDIEDAISTIKDGQYLGITLTDAGFAAHESDVEKLFILLDSHNVDVQTTKDILSQ